MTDSKFPDFQAGDEIEMEIEGLGILNNTIRVIKSN